MNPQIIILLTHALIIYANVQNSFIIDYFMLKKVSSVVGFSCNNEMDDFILIRNLSHAGLSASIRKLDENHQISRFAFSNYSKLGIFLDLRCYNRNMIESVFDDASENRFFGELHFWVIFGFGSTVRDSTDIIREVNFGFSTNFVIVIPFEKRSGYILYDVYNPWKERGTSINVTFLGSWSMVSGFNIVLTQPKIVRRSNMNGIVLRTFFFKSKYRPPETPLEDYYRTYSLFPKDGICKFGYIMNFYLAEMFNFTLKPGVAAVWEKGDPLGPIIRGVNNKESDITGCPPVMNLQRSKLVKFVHQSWPFRTCFMFRSPQPKNIKINEILGPFNIEVWYLMVIFFMISLFAINAVFQNDYDEKKNLRFSNSLLVIIGAICQQGTDMKMNQLSTRLAFFCVMMCSLLLYNFYSACVVSTRLNEPIYKMNDSLNELSKSDIKVSSEWMDYFEYFLKRKDWETEQFVERKWKHVEPSDQFVEPQKAILMARKGDFAYHTHPDVGYQYINRYYSNREICELTEIHLVRPTTCTFAVNLNNTFVEMLRVGLTKLSEVGVRRRQVKRWTVRKPRCLTSVLSASSIDIYEFAPHLLLLIFGMMLAVVVYLLEKIKWKIETSDVSRLDSTRISECSRF